MKRNATAADRLKYAAPIAISFILTFLLMLFVYRVCHYAPWGNRSLATDDGYWQYMDFFGYYKDFFSGKSNLEYSFSNGLGMPGLGLFMYYLSSPFNLLIVFFKKENFHEFFDIMVALKLAAAASTACFYLKKRFKDKINILISIALSVSYAFMQYSFSKAACSMWLDGVFMLPLMLWGVYKLVNEKKPGFLSVTVGLTIFFNWYAAGMACMFSILWFFAEMILFSSQNRLESVKKEIGRFFGGVVRYGVSMLIGVGLSAVLFLPMVYQILQATRGSATWEFLKNSFHGNIFNVIPQYSMGMTSARGALCIFCGGLALLGVIGFFASKKIKTVYKWVLGAVLLIGILSCYWQPLFFITSLFQDEGSYYYRYSYMCCFTMLFMAGAFFSEEETKENAKTLWIGSVIYIVLLLVGHFVWGSTELNNVYATAGIQAAMAILFMLVVSFKEKKLWRNVFLCLLSAVTVCEMTYNASLLMERYSSYTDVAAFKVYQSEQQALVNRLKASDTSDYRMTQTSGRAGGINQLANLNESLGFGYRAIESYTSMPAENQIKLLDKSGYVIYHDILVEKAMSILSIDSLLGVKYIMTSYPYEGLAYKEELGSGNGKVVYENPYYMPFAFKISSAGDFSAGYEYNTYLWQNELFKHITGEDKDIFIPAQYYVAEEDGSHRIYSFEIPEGNYALYGNIPWFTDDPCWTNEGAYLDLNDRLGMSYSTIHSVTNFYIPISKGDTSAYVGFYSEILGRFMEPQFYLLDLDYLDEISSRARANAPADLKVTDGSLTCTVTGSEGERLFTSVPYFKGWTVTKNGQKIEPEFIEDCLMVIPLEAGNNEIVMKFHTPYLGLGIAVTVISLIALIAWSIIQKKNLGNKENRRK